MTLSEAIEEVKLEVDRGDVFESGEFNYSINDIDLRTAIATILNAVVRGELK